MSKILIIIYPFLFIIFAFLTYLFIDPNFIYLKSLYTGFYLSHRLITSALYILFILIMFASYYFIILGKNERHSVLINKFWPIFLVGIFSYPAILSFDLFNYIATAKTVFHYFENPYIIMPIEFNGDPVLLFTHAANKVALYGPLWIFLTSIPYYLSFGYYLISVILFKVFISVFYFGIVYLIQKMTKSAYSVLFFAASPLVIIETFVSGHNDVVMMFFALASFYYLKNKKVFLAILFLIMSVLIKYATLFLIPVYIYYFYSSFRHLKIDWDKIYLIAFLLTLLIFFLSPLREEIYPWYAIWPLVFISLIAEKKKMLSLVFIFFCFCLMLRYVPYMYFATHFGPTPYIKIAVTFIPSLILLCYFYFKTKFKNIK